MPTANKPDTKKHILSGFARYLIAKQILTEPIVLEAMEAALHINASFIFYLIEKKILTPAITANVVAEYFKLPLVDLAQFDINLIPLDLLNLEIVQKHEALPLVKKQNHLSLAVIDPTLPKLAEIKFRLGLDTELLIVEADKLNSLIDRLLNKQLINALGDLGDNSLDQLYIVQEEEKAVDPIQETQIDTAPVIRFINKILLDAIYKNASDIHFEPYENYYRIRFRQDGILYEVAKPPISLVNYLVARLKIMAKLDISERRIPLDGRFKLTLKHRTIDFRVSTCPMLYGEKVAIRILDTLPEFLSIENLGMDNWQKKLFLQAMQRSQGMILVTGPTGSGKTTTLYTALNMLNTVEKNISTVEDPVEINLGGINQVNINPKIGLSFAAALRSFLRQDPDIIMVGEIRDLETAEIAIKAAQTGHLVLSTLHTNSAAQTILRLANMGVPAFNLASAINIIIAQRLVRKLCNHCKKPLKFSEATLLAEGFLKDEIDALVLYEPVGCKHCTNGYKGRTSIYEVMLISEKINRLIIEGHGPADIEEMARQEGMISLRQAGLAKIKQGLTSLTELNRVIKD